MVPDMDIYPLSVDSGEYEHACEVTDCFGDNGIEPPVKYIIRKRTVDLARLVNDAIEKELTDIERLTITQMYFENKKAAQIAEETGINRASVSRTVLRAQNKLHSALKYAVMYITDFADAALVPAALQKSAQTASAMRMKPKNLSERLFALRASRGISEKVLARALEIPHERINKLEAGSECASADEITRYCAFFSVSADTLLGIV